MKFIEFENIDEAKLAFLNKDIRITKNIVGFLKENPKVEHKKNIIELYCKEEKVYIDLFLSPEDINEALDLALKNLEKHEMYEECLDVVELIEKYK